MVLLNDGNCALPRSLLVEKRVHAPVASLQRRTQQELVSHLQRRTQLEDWLRKSAGDRYLWTVQLYINDCKGVRVAVDGVDLKCRPSAVAVDLCMPSVCLSLTIIT